MVGLVWWAWFGSVGLVGGFASAWYGFGFAYFASLAHFAYSLFLAYIAPFLDVDVGLIKNFVIADYE